MYQSYQIIFCVGILGAIISFILLIIGIIKDIKMLKIITIIYTTIFVVIFSAGISLGYYNYKDSNDVANQVNKTQKSDAKITSGNSNDPVVVTEKSFYDGAT